MIGKLEHAEDASSADPRRRLHRFAHEAMACTFELIIVGDEAEYFDLTARAAFEELDRIEQELSRFVSHSDVARINRAPCGEAVKVGPEAFECLTLAAEVHEGTGGAFDVTVGGPTDGVRPYGMKLLSLDPSAHTVTCGADGLTVDLGGVGKGYAVDRIVEQLRAWSITSALVQSGQSTVRAIGTDAAGGAWTVQLRRPGDAEGTIGTVEIGEDALSGSGRFHHGSHIVDPRTGRPAEGALGAWAKTPSAALADALSTAFMVMDAAQVQEYCRAHKYVSAMMALPEGEELNLVRYGAGLG